VSASKHAAPLNQNINIMDTNGIPTIAVAQGAVEENEVQITGASTPQVSIPALVTALLNVVPTAQRIVIDTKQRKIVSADADVTEAGNAALFAGVTKKIQTIAPEDGQEGRAVTWEEVSRDGGMTAELPDAVKAEVDPARPVRSLATMLGTVLASVPDGLEPVIIIDQEAGTVQIIDVTAGRATFETNLTALADAIPADSAHGAVVTLSEPAEDDGGETPLKFEGGAFGA